MKGLTRKDLEEWNDYLLFLKDIGVTAEQMDIMTEKDIPYIPHVLGQFVFIDSEIHGIGMFSRFDYSPGMMICEGMIGRTWTEAGRFVNHAKDANMEAVPFMGGFHFIARKNIHPKEEMTVNYRSVKAALEKEAA